MGALSTNNSEIPNHFGLNNIYPNPFNPITTIEFFVPNNMLFDLSIYNIQGRIIENIFSNHLGTGFNPLATMQKNYLVVFILFN